MPAVKSRIATPQLAVAPRVSRPTLLRGSLALFGLILLGFFPVLFATWNWDDAIWVTQNAVLRDWWTNAAGQPSGLQVIWFHPGQLENYYPVVYTMFLLQFHLVGQNAGLYHEVNLLLHVLNAVLLWRVALRLPLPNHWRDGAWLGALLWAIHPVQVETVGWVAEQKNLFSTLFAFLAVLAYFRFDAAPRRRAGRVWYAVGLLCFVLGLLSKTVVVTAPAALALIIWWRDGVITRQTIARLLPWFVIGLLMVPVAIYGERYNVGSTGAGLEFSWPERFLMAAHGIWFYLRTIVWPYPLLLVYPKYNINPHTAAPYLYAALTVAALAILWVLRHRIGRAPVAALVAYIIMLSPALGFVSFYTLHFTFTADHYQYFANSAVFLFLGGALTWAYHRFTPMPDIFASPSKRNPAPAPQRQSNTAGLLKLGTILLSGTWILLSNRQSDRFSDYLAIWRYTVDFNPTSEPALQNYAGGLQFIGKIDEALIYAKRAEAIAPEDWKTHMTLADLYHARGDVTAEATEYALSIRYKPAGAKLYSSSEMIHQPAAPLQQSSIDTKFIVDPPLLDAPYQQAATLQLQRQFEPAIAAYRAYLATAPQDGMAHLNLANCLAQTGDFSAAAEEYQAASDLEPTNAKIAFNLALAQMQLGKGDDAFRTLARAVKLDPTLIKRLPR
jgi:Flp pilus assembly protein TadD